MSKIMDSEDWCRLFHHRRNWIELKNEFICAKCLKCYCKVEVKGVTVIKLK